MQPSTKNNIYGAQAETTLHSGEPYFLCTQHPAHVAACSTRRSCILSPWGKRVDEPSPCDFLSITRSLFSIPQEWLLQFRGQILRFPERLCSGKQRRSGNSYLTLESKTKFRWCKPIMLSHSALSATNLGMSIFPVKYKGSLLGSFWKSLRFLIKGTDKASWPFSPLSWLERGCNVQGCGNHLVPMRW